MGSRLLSRGIEEFFGRAVAVADGFNDEGSWALGLAVREPVELSLNYLDGILADELHRASLAYPQLLEPHGGEGESVLAHRWCVAKKSRSLAEASSSEWKKAQSGSPPVRTPMP